MQDGYYHLAIRNNPVQRFWHSKKFEIVAAKGGETPVVDIGCGPGVFFNMYGKFDGLKINLDYSFGQLSYSQKMTPGVSHIHASATDLPFASESISTVLLIETIEHLNAAQISKVLSEILRVLKKKGRAIISTPNYKSIWPFLEILVSAIGPVNYTKEHITHFDIKSLNKIVRENGLTLIDIKSIFIISPFFALISDKLAAFIFRIEQKFFSKWCADIIIEVIKE
jgi:ubiquinone/menaquinone biosynthesis C-methylase UbiE